MRNPLRYLFKRSTIIGQPWHWLTRTFSTSSSAGVSVTPDSALKVAAVAACIKVISETLASLPLMLYERVGDNGKKPAVDHPLYSLLHDAPNDYMTAYEFREIEAAHLNLRGNFYARKQENGRGIKALIPLSPGRMEPTRENGTVLYRYTHEDGTQEALPADKVWHVKNLSITSLFNGEAPEGLVGLSPIALARESIGLALAADEYGGRYFSNNAQVGLNFQYPGKLSKNARELLKESLEEYGRLENKFKSIITEEGAKLERLGLSNEDSQFLQSRQFQIEEIARIFRIPPILIGHPTNTMTYASAEQLFLAFATYTIRPWCVRIEQSMNRWLLSEKDRKKYFFEHVMAGLLRGDTLSRYNAYAVARNWGWMNVDEIRSLENMNPLPDNKGEIYLQPMNMKEPGEEPAKPPKPGNGSTPPYLDGKDNEEEKDNAAAEA